MIETNEKLHQASGQYDGGKKGVVIREETYPLCHNPLSLLEP